MPVDRDTMAGSPPTRASMAEIADDLEMLNVLGAPPPADTDRSQINAILN
ncbi:MAG: hypothetical protein ACR2KP_15705 [Egibacteraceae bacterium]